MAGYASGTITALNGTVSVPTGAALGSYCIQVEGVSPNTVILEGSQDGSTYLAFQVLALGGNGILQTNITSDNIYFMPIAGVFSCRVRCTAYTSGTISVFIYGTDVTIDNPNVNAILQAGSNNIGTVGLASGTNNVGTVGLAAGSNNIGSVTIAAGSGVGISPSTYAIVPAGAGTTTVKNSAGVQYGVYLNGASLLGSVAVLDGSTTVLPTSLLGSVLATAPFTVNFPNGIQFLTSIKVTLAGVSTSSVTVLYR